MAGTTEGGKKAAETQKERYGENIMREHGAEGGKSHQKAGGSSESEQRSSQSQSGSNKGSQEGKK